MLGPVRGGSRLLAVISCNDIAPGAIPQPNGTYACQWTHAEKARADQDNFVIYQYEWSADGTKLTPSGQGHVAQIAQGLCQVPFPVVIEPSSDRRVDESVEWPFWRPLRTVAIQ